VYEYYSSAADLVTGVLVDEFTAWSRELAQVTSPEMNPLEQVHAWVHGVITYVADGRHALLRAAGSIELPPDQRTELTLLHHELLAPLVSALTAAERADADRIARFIWGVTDVAIARIEVERADPALEEAAVLAFIDGALTLPKEPTS
jgi:AcrR family transcriptional regulator